MKREPETGPETNARNKQGLSRFYTESTSDSSEERDVDASALSSMRCEPAEKYVVRDGVGEGGMKRILKVRDRNAARDVAMALTSDSNDDPERLERFVREARVTANLEHPNIIPVHDIGVDDSRHPYFTMKLVHGEDLSVILKRMSDGDSEALSQFDPARMMTIFRKVCDAVAFAHSKGILHLDLKPENILVGDFGEVLVLDWGLSKIVQSNDASVTMDAEANVNDDAFASTIQKRLSSDGSFIDATMDGVIKGTLGYMAPEQAMGRNAEKDHRTDIYALGAILYSILTLERPIDHDSPEMVLLDTTKGNVIPPRKRRPDRGIPPALEAVTLRAMALEPDDRYQTVENLSRDVDAFLGGFATSAEGAGLPTQLYLLCKRHHRETALLAASFATLGILAAMFVSRLNDEKNAAVEARNIAQQAEMEAELALDKVREERRKRVQISKKAAPEFVTKARKHMATGRWDKAKRAVDVALALDRESEVAWELSGRLALGDLKFDQAATAFEKAGRTAAKLLEFTRRQAAKMPDSHGDVSSNQRLTMAMELEKLDAPIVAARLLAENTGNSRDALALVMGTLEERLRSVNPGLTSLNMEFHQDRDDVVLSLEGNDGLQDISPLRGLPINVLSLAHTNASNLNALRGMPLRVLNLAGTNVADLTPLKGMRLRKLDASETPIDDLTPLKDMPLRELNLSGTNVTDLTPLKGAPLSRLDIERTRISCLTPLRGMKLVFLNAGETNAVGSIAPLRGMPIEELVLNNVPIQDVSPLRGMDVRELELAGSGVQDLTPLREAPLERLILSGTDVSDISPLRNAPLRELSLGDCRGLSDLTPLSSNETLERLVIPPHVENISFLAKLPRLKYLDDHLGEGGTTSRAAFDFWRERTTRERSEQAKMDKIRALRDALRKANPRQKRLRFHCEANEEGLVLDLADNPQLKDINPLRGLPIHCLRLDNTRVSDLRPLRGAPLRSLFLNGTNVSSIVDLRGSKIEELELGDCRIENLSPLRTMPIQRLVIGGPSISNLEDLRGLPLRSLMVFSDQLRDISPLRGTLLEELELTAPVKDLSPLSGMPLRRLTLCCPRVESLPPLQNTRLRELHLLDCDRGLDFGPLKNCSFLTRLTIPAGMKNTRELRSLSNLRFLDDTPPHPEEQTRSSEEFWRDFDAIKRKE